MKQKQLITAMLSLCMVTNMCGTVFADNVTYEEKRGTPVTISLENGEDLTADEFVVKVPKKVRASKEQSVPYTVTVSGKLKDGNVLHVVPNDKVTLTSGDSDIVLESNVTQDKTDFDSEELGIYDEVETNGSVGVVERADGGDIDEVNGSYSGNMVFNISVDDGTTSDEPTKTYGLVTPDGETIAWQTLIDDGNIVVDDTAITKCDTSLAGILTIDENITKIDDNAFQQCTLLTSIDVPDAVDTIGTNAFGNVYNIKYNGAATGFPWGAYAVNGCVDGDWIYADDTKTNVLAYVGTVSDTFTIPDGVTKIGYSYSFSDYPNCNQIIKNNAKSLKTIIFPEGVTEIGANTFSNINYVESITLPSTLKSIDEFAFYGNSELRSISLPDGLESIGKNALSGCRIFNLTVPDTVNHVDATAFASTTGTVYEYSVANVMYDGDVSGAPWGASFLNKYAEDDKIYPDSNKEELLLMDMYTFNVFDIPDTVKKIGDYACAYIQRNLSIDESNAITYGFPNSITEIGSHAFEGAKFTSALIIPDSVVSIGDDAFKDLPLFYYDGYASGTPWGADCYRSLNGGLLNGKGHTIYTWAYLVKNGIITVDGTKITDADCSDLDNTYDTLLISSTITEIGDNAFDHQQIAKQVIIPSSVKRVGQHAFASTSIYNMFDEECYGIQSIEFIDHSGDDSLTIGVYAFDSCNGLKTLQLPIGLKKIPDNMCTNCYSLESVTIPYTVTSIGRSAFLEDANLTCTIPDSVTTISAGAFASVKHIYYNGTATGSPWGASAIN